MTDPETPNPMFLTVTIQTYNRAETLDLTLKSLRTLHRPPASDYEILIIDNNSSDTTPEIVRKHATSHLPQIRYIFEPQQGLSHARNRALKEARGQIVCFLDDDVMVDSQWLVAVSSAFAKYSADVVGGRSYLIYPGKRPAWMSRRTEVLLSRLDHGDKTLVNTERDLFGLNFSIGRNLAIELGGFKTDLGRCGNSLNCGEETELLDRVRNMGGMVVYEPKAVVGHVIPPQRLSKSWLLRRTYAGAVTAERLLIAKGKVNGLGQTFIHIVRCWGSVVKSLLWRRDNASTVFDKQYFAVCSLGKLSATLNRLSDNMVLKFSRKT